MIEVGVLLAIGVLAVVFSVLGFVLRALGVLTGRRALAPHELNRRRATGAAFIGAFCVYLVQIGGWPLDQLPPWAPSALMATAGAALLLILAGIVGARERDPSGVVISLIIAGGSYAMLQWQWYVPRDYFAADLIHADLVNRLVLGLYVATVVAGLANAALCLLPFDRTHQPTPYDSARRRAVAAAFVVALCIYVLNGGRLPFGALPPWMPSALMAVAGLSLLVLASGLWATRDVPRDFYGIGVSLAVVAATAALLWWRWQLPPGPVSAPINALLPGLYVAVLSAALVRALIYLRVLGGARRFIERLRKRRASGMRPASSGPGFWAEMRESFLRGFDGRPWRN